MEHAYFPVYFQETIEACEVKVCTYSQLNEYITIYDRQPKVKVIHWPLSEVTQIQHFQTFFPNKNTTTLEAKFHMELPGDSWDENLFKCSGSHDQGSFQVHIW